MGRLLVAASFLTFLTMGCEMFFGYQNDSVFLFWFNYNGLPFLLSVIVFIIVRQMQIPDFDSLFTTFHRVIQRELYFAKSENEAKYDGMFFGKLVNAYETGKSTVDEVNEQCWKYVKARSIKFNNILNSNY
jgi:hypothetical protein